MSPRCIVCGEERLLLVSGVRPSTDPRKPLGESVAVCEKPSCREGLQFVRENR